MKEFKGLGIGLRDEFMYDLLESDILQPNWLEIIPENWFVIPKKHQKLFKTLVDKYPIMCHGVSLSIASDSSQMQEGMSKAFLIKMKSFLNEWGFKNYSEHFSFCHLHGKQTYELLPPPLTKKSVQTIVDNIDYVQNFLNRELILENASWYYNIEPELSESEFINQICKQSGAKLLLDINNVYVNSKNHNFSPHQFIKEIDKNHIAYHHIAGHLKTKDGDLIDTHGAKVKNDVLELLDFTLKIKKSPVLLERDNNIPPFKTLAKEFNKIKEVCDNA